MSHTDCSPFPLVTIQAVSNIQQQWVGLLVEVAPPQGDDLTAALGAIFGDLEMAGALAHLDWILPLPDLRGVGEKASALLPPECVQPLFPASAITDTEDLAAWRERGYRVLIEGTPATGMPGMYLVRGIDTRQARQLAEQAGATLFVGRDALDVDTDAERDDGTSRKRLLALLALLARDADTRELEHQVKQDPALAYHLLKLANSAAMGVTKTIDNFGQAITVLGRRQLQRWLQLLLYARQQEDGPVHPLLPLAAMRAATMEALCRQQGGPAASQDQAFMTGMFSLLDRLFGMDMASVCGALTLPREVEAALLKRQGIFGRYLDLLEAPDADHLQRAESDPQQWWKAQLAGYRWAIQVSRDL